MAGLVIVLALFVLGVGRLQDDRNGALVEQGEATPAASPEVQSDQDPDTPRIEQILVPPMSIEEFTSPNFVSTSPAHGTAASLNTIDAIRIRFSEELLSASKITVLAGNKLIASGGKISPDGKTLALALEFGSFGAREYPTAAYEVYYDACFVGETCFKGQYAFFGFR